MNKFIYPFVFSFIVILANVQAQKASIELVFSSVLGSMPISSDSYTITNLSGGGDTVLFYPDTLLVLNYVDIQDNFAGNESSFSVSRSFPNPAKEQSKFEISIPSSGEVQIRAVNPLGRQLALYGNKLNSGRHLFSFYPGKDRFYMIWVSWNGMTQSIKVIGDNSASAEKCTLKYEHPVESSPVLKSGNASSSFGYNYGDELLVVGNYEGEESQLRDIPTSSKTYQLQFGKNIPCPGTPTVSYLGQVYNTVQVLNQCWMKENLDAGLIVNGIFDQTDNGVIEKYCYENDPVNCTIYGGLYQWDELMDYVPDGQKGICPDGWHVPTDADWKVLEGAVDSEYSIANEIWDQEDWRGSDAGGKLKDTGTQLWMPPNSGANNESGFTAIPGGFRDYTGNGFQGKGYGTILWSSTEMDYFSARARNLNNDHADVGRSSETKTFGFSVRCIKDAGQ
ncbi:MAG: hypothetical protein GXO89_15115 [Chlorobi bacterium]|nr:hypothetical protein [Chlorobiota bacterium]